MKKRILALLIALCTFLTVLFGCQFKPAQFTKKEKGELEMTLYEAPDSSDSEITGSTFDDWKTRTNLAIDKSFTEKGLYANSNTPNSATLAWGGSYFVSGLIKMYGITKNKYYIMLASQAIQYMYDNMNDENEDGFIGYTTSTYSQDKVELEEYLVHYGVVMTEWAKFVLVVQSEPDLMKDISAAGVTYKEQAKRLMEYLELAVVPHFEHSWNEEYKVYTDEKRDDWSMAANRYLAFANMFYYMSIINPKNPLYLERFDKMLETFKKDVTPTKLPNNETAFVWRYWAKIMETDSTRRQVEDFSHAHFDTYAAILSYNRGGVFKEDSDMIAFSNTFAKQMRKLDTPIGDQIYLPLDNSDITNRVDGVKALKEKPGYIRRSHVYFSIFNKDIWKLAELATNSKYTTSASMIDECAFIYQFHPEMPAPSQPVLNTTVQRSKTNNYWSLIWQHSQNSAFYTIEISDKKDFSNIVVKREHILDNGTVVDNLKKGTKYFWRVTANNNSGETNVSTAGNFRA